jgi:microcystin-dependent protein
MRVLFGFLLIGLFLLAIFGVMRWAWRRISTNGGSAAMSENAFLGEIRMVAFNFAPVGWAPCDGRLMSISQNQAMFAILGVNYGGDGKSNFALPNLPPLNGTYFIICLSGIFPTKA